jgi:hypothetical protein
MREGQTLVLKYRSPVSHALATVVPPASKNATGGAPIAAGSERRIRGLVADRYPIMVGCKFHPWMQAWVRVFDHPYFAVTDADGDFEIKDAPAGKYRLVVWHATGGYLGGREARNGRPITIRAGGTMDLGELRWK